MGNKNSKHNVIFIDIDGVLNSLEFHNRDRSKKKLFDRECVERLAEIVRGFNCLVVLASTWIVLNIKEKVERCTRQEDGVKSSSAMYFKLLNELQSVGIRLYDQIEDEHIRPIGINDWLIENIEIVKNYVIKLMPLELLQSQRKNQSLLLQYDLQKIFLSSLWLR